MKRASLYRGLAEICGDAAEGVGFLQLAEGIERTERQCREIEFQFSMGKDGK
jgi:hypothetical protein